MKHSDKPMLILLSRFSVLTDNPLADKDGNEFYAAKPLSFMSLTIMMFKAQWFLFKMYCRLLRTRII